VIRNRWSRYIGKQTNYWIFIDLAHSLLFLVAMLPNVGVETVEIEPYTDLL
jgi:hypothetical protein